MSIFRSRKFYLALFAVVQALVFNYFDVDPEVWQSIAALVAVLIASIAYEDGATKRNESNPTRPGPDVQ